MNDRYGFVRPCRVPMLLLLLSFAFHLAFPQSGTGGSVAGQVSDSGGRLFAALVTLRNTATGSQSQMLCDRNGNFRFAELAPGTSSVRVSAPGLAAWKMDRVIVEVGRVTLLAPKLTLAYGDNTVSANDHGSQSDLSPAVSSNIDQHALDNLPSSGGQWSGLAALSAGSAPAGEDNTLSFRGLSPLMNSITIDGADHNLAFRGVSAAAAATATPPPRRPSTSFR